MEFLQNIVAVLRYEPASFAVPFFVFSVLLLCIGLGMKIYAHAFQLRFLDHVPLSKIEHTHPHLPSPRTILVIVLCTITLLLAGLHSMEGIFPFNDPFQGLNLASLFLLFAAVGVLAELRWKGTREYAGAFLTGTALAFLVLIIQSRGPTDPAGQNIFTITLLVPSLLLVGYTFPQKHKKGALLTLFLSFCFWMLLTLLS